MIKLFSVEFWLLVLFFINFSLVLCGLIFIRKMNELKNQLASGPAEDEEDTEHQDWVRDRASDIIEMIEPLVKESRETAMMFDEQIKDKKRLLKGLNDALDSRIININLLLSRADAMQKKIEERQAQSAKAFSSLPGPEIRDSFSPVAVGNQQEQILSLYEQQCDIDDIARKLSIPKGEVQLVVDLKKKFQEMEKNSR